MGSTRAIKAGLFVDGPEGPRLIVGRCASCTRPSFPLSVVCPYCGSDGVAETKLGPSGRLWLYTAVRSRPPGYTGAVPYGFGIVDLDGGLRVISRLTEAEPDRLRPGMAMRLVLEPIAEDDDGTRVVSFAFAPDSA
jgi:uncharacterized OB-fold protein